MLFFSRTSITDPAPSQEQKLEVHKQTKNSPKVLLNILCKTEINCLLLSELSVLTTRDPPKVVPSKIQKDLVRH